MLAAAATVPLVAAGLALERARNLSSSAPISTSVEAGEYDHHEWWTAHEKTLAAGWTDLPPLHPDFVTVNASVFDAIYVTDALREAVRAARADPSTGEEAVRRLFTETAPGVYAADVVTAAFRERLLAELRHRRAAGIPIRRPNGMNRYGAILDDIGLGVPVSHLVHRYLRPLAQMLYPSIVGPGDADEYFAFAVRYAVGDDTELAAHTDASTVTFNVCLGDTFEGGGVFFEGLKLGHTSGEDATPRTTVPMQPGASILHRGARVHGAEPLLSGERENMIVWLSARWGVVRVVDYEAHEQSTADQRWRGDEL